VCKKKHQRKECLHKKDWWYISWTKYYTYNKEEKYYKWQVRQFGERKLRASLFDGQVSGRKGLATAAAPFTVGVLKVELRPARRMVMNWFLPDFVAATHCKQ